uniref:butyrophilin subfamily 1 member A1-like n=1 Tax=Podarcis muralis TaxID=64176 RepID=UPI0010A0C0B0|nr:butyrophilin subfamily 1 member A1-like [Podarcis muralis]
MWQKVPRREQELRCQLRETFKNPMDFLSKLKRWISKFCIKNPILYVGMKDIKANVTLHPDTARQWLLLYEDQSNVIYRDKYLLVPNNPERFNYWHCVLGHQGFTAGRHFWEVAVESAEGWVLMVASKCEWRRGCFKVRREGRIWCVRMEEDEYEVSNCRRYSPLSLSEKPRRIRVTLDYEGGCLSFSDAYSGTELYTFSEDSFYGETLLPFIWLWGKAPLSISWGD